MNIIVSEYCVEQFRFPRTKKRRIRNKWAQRDINFRPARKGFLMGNDLIVHPTVAARLRTQMLIDGDATVIATRP